MDDRKKILLVYDHKTSTVEFTDINKQTVQKFDGVMLFFGNDDKGYCQMLALGNLASLAGSFARFSTNPDSRKLFGLIAQTLGANGEVLGCQECAGRDWEREAPKSIN